MAWSSEVTHLVLRNAEFGQPYTTAMVAIGDEGTATVKCLCSQHVFSRADWNSLCAELRRHGFHTIRYARHRENGVRWIMRRL
jgi:hypothetical protein